MGWIVAIIVGGVAGWLASMVMARDGSMGIFWNIIVGIVIGYDVSRHRTVGASTDAVYTKRYVTFIRFPLRIEL